VGPGGSPRPHAFRRGDGDERSLHPGGGVGPAHRRVYALLSIGLTMIFGVVRIINFAHGEIMMLAMYLTYWLHAAYGVDPYLSLFAVAPVLFLLGIVIQRLVIQPILDAPALMKVFATVGLYIAFAESGG